MTFSTAVLGGLNLCDEKELDILLFVIANFYQSFWAFDYS